MMVASTESTFWSAPLDEFVVLSARIYDGSKNGSAVRTGPMQLTEWSTLRKVLLDGSANRTRTDSDSQSAGTNQRTSQGFQCSTGRHPSSKKEDIDHKRNETEVSK